LIEPKAEFQLEVSENNVIFFPSEFTDPLKSILGPVWGVDPRLRTAVLVCTGIMFIASFRKFSWLKKLDVWA
jgi:hypothetical protein